MYKTIIIILAIWLVGISTPLYSQLQPGNVSDDGEFVADSYLPKQYNKNSNQESCLVIKSTTNSWRKEFRYWGNSTANTFFSYDGRFVCFKTPAFDSLYIIKLGTDEIRYFENVGIFQLGESNNKLRWVAYRPIGPNKKLVIIDLMSNEEESFEFIEAFRFCQSGNAIFFEKDSLCDYGHRRVLYWFDLKNNKLFNIWPPSHREITSYTFDNSQHQIAFLVNGGNNTPGTYSIWYYKEGDNQASKLIDNFSLGTDSLKIANGALSFSEKDGGIYFSLTKKLLLKKGDELSRG